MGSFLVDAVLNGLKGREFSLPIGGTREKPKIKSFGAQEIAFLLTIASRQPNPGALEGDLDPICFGDPATLQSLMHIKNSAFFESRKFLQKLGLVRFNEEEIRPDPKNPERVHRYTNVYRIGLKKLRELQPDLETWRKGVLKIGDSAAIPEGVLRALQAYEPVPCPEEVRNTESLIRNTESRVRNTDTNTITNTLNKIPKDTTSHAEDFVGIVCGLIAEKLGVRREFVRDSMVEKVIKGKYSESVLNLIDNLGKTQDTRWVFKADNPIASVVSLLRKLPDEQEDPVYRRKYNPTPDQLLEDVPSEVVRQAVKDMIAATGCTDRRCVEKFISTISSLNEKRADFGLVYDQIEVMRKSQTPIHPLSRALGLLDGLEKLLG